MTEKEIHPPEEVMPEGVEEAPPGTRAMAVVRWLLIALMATAAVAAWFSYWGITESAQRHAEKATLYYCPMHPSVVQDHPGECPICSMTLVPKPASDPAGGAMPPTGARTTGVSGLSPVDLTPERIQLLGMRQATVTRERVGGEIRTVGYVAASEQGLARIQTRFAGWIEHLYVAQTGERVTRGQQLAAIYSPEVLAAEQELVNALGWASDGGGQVHAMTAGLVDDTRRRLELLGIAREEIDEVARTGKPIRALKIRSTVDGYVTAKLAVEGAYAQPGADLFEVADLSSVWVLADIYEADVTRVHVGEHAAFVLASGERFTGRVAFLNPTLDGDSRTLRARVELPNRGLKLRPGMYGDVVIDVPTTASLAIPIDALVDTGDQRYVFVALPGGHFEPRAVHVGARSRDKVEVLDGVREGEAVVTTANFLIDSESRLRSAIEGMTPGSVAADAQSAQPGK